MNREIVYRGKGKYSKSKDWSSKKDHMPSRRNRRRLSRFSRFGGRNWSRNKVKWVSEAKVPNARKFTERRSNSIQGVVTEGFFWSHGSQVGGSKKEKFKGYQEV